METKLNMGKAGPGLGDQWVKMNKVVQPGSSTKLAQSTYHLIAYRMGIKINLSVRE